MNTYVATLISTLETLGLRIDERVEFPDACDLYLAPPAPAGPCLSLYVENSADEAAPEATVYRLGEHLDEDRSLAFWSERDPRRLARRVLALVCQRNAEADQIPTPADGYRYCMTCFWIT